MCAPAVLPFPPAFPGCLVEHMLFVMLKGISPMCGSVLLPHCPLAMLHDHVQGQLSGDTDPVPLGKIRRLNEVSKRCVGHPCVQDLAQIIHLPINMLRCKPCAASGMLHQQWSLPGGHASYIGTAWKEGM